MPLAVETNQRAGGRSHHQPHGDIGPFELLRHSSGIQSGTDRPINLSRRKNRLGSADSNAGGRSMVAWSKDCGHHPE
jgi:hypothetical protein